MQQLLESRRILIEDEGVRIKLADISPEKYGKGAYCHLSYTPSKLADNVLYKQVTTMKKVEENSSKYREAQAFKSLFKDRLEQLQAQRDGIQSSLMQQINMYRKMLHEMEIKHEARIKQIQETFTTEIHKIIAEKQEESKYAQSEIELLEKRIYELEQIIADLKGELGRKCADYDFLTNEHEKLNINFANLEKKLNQTIIRNEQQVQKSKDQYKKLQIRLQKTQQQCTSRLEKQNQQNIRQRQKLQRQYKNQIQKHEIRHRQQSRIKNEEMKDIRNTFEKQTHRLNEVIKIKDQQVSKSKNDQNQQRTSTFSMIKKYENEITNLVNDNKHINEQKMNLAKDKQMLTNELKKLEGAYRLEKKNLEENGAQLKKQLEMNQVNYIRQRDRNDFMAGDLERQMSKLRADNAELIAIHDSNKNTYSLEVVKLKDLLRDSCFEIDRCKQQYTITLKQRDSLIVQLRELGFQNQALHRLKIQHEYTIQSFRDSTSNSFYPVRY